MYIHIGMYKVNAKGYVYIVSHVKWIVTICYFYIFILFFYIIHYSPSFSYMEVNYMTYNLMPDWMPPVSRG